MISAVLIFTSRGELLVSKVYRSSLKKTIADIFRIQVINNLDVRSPILTLGSTTFHHIRSGDPDNLWIVTVSRNNVNSAAIWEFLYKFKSMLHIYGLNKEDTLKEEFMTCYEILDIMLAIGGIPQETELGFVINSMSSKPPGGSNALRGLDINDKNNNGSNSHSNLPNIENVTGFPKFLRKNSSNPSHPSSNSLDFATWKPNSIISKNKNEVILNVNESIYLLVSKDGSILKAFVDGTIDFTTNITGSPVCQVGLNDSLNIDHNGYENWAKSDISNQRAIPKAAAGSVMLEDCKFHQCVSLEMFDKDRVIRFTPPEGKMELMKYHVRDNLNLPFKISPIVTNTSNGNALDYRVTIKSLFPSKLSAKDVLLTIPVPPGTVDCKINVSNGSCKFDPETSAMIWKFNKYNGLTENKLSAVTVSTSDTTQLTLQQWPRPPMSLNFELVMFSNSGLVVRYFTISKGSQKYQAVKWIKYISRSGAYEVRY